MKAPKQIAKPENRQDFESLCKKLWGEIWQCQEIKKNGRRGQKQAGVDVYGIPKGEKEYYGIQCKGKDHYIKAKLTEEEIDNEIKKAKTFEPKLKKLYFTTTSNKDANIEKYIRKKNLSHIEKGLFEIYLYCREDIIDLLEENPETYNYYVNSINFKNQNCVELTFEGGEKEIKRNAYFLNTKKIYKYKGISVNNLGLNESIKSLIQASSSFSPFGEYKGENHSEISFKLKLKNTGNQILENYKISLEFSGEIDEVYHNSSIIHNLNKYADCCIQEDTMSGVLDDPEGKPLVPKDIHLFDIINIIPKVGGGEIKIKWELLSKYFHTGGVLRLVIDSNIIDHQETITVLSQNEEKEETKIEYFYLTEEVEKTLEELKSNTD